MQQRIIPNFKILFFISVVLITLAYSYYQTKDFIQGPILEISEPINGVTLSEDVLKIKGFAKNIAYLSLNDRQVYVDEEGNLAEKILLFPGYNIIKISAKDKFERKTERKLEVVLLN
ncbi:MAG: hypothetical protein V1851_03390 [Patescibacteria group bacterium]